MSVSLINSFNWPTALIGASAGIAVGAAAAAGVAYCIWGKKGKVVVPQPDTKLDISLREIAIDTFEGQESAKSDSLTIQSLKAELHTVTEESNHKIAQLTEKLKLTNGYIKAILEENAWFEAEEERVHIVSVSRRERAEELKKRVDGLEILISSKENQIALLTKDNERLAERERTHLATARELQGASVTIQSLKKDLLSYKQENEEMFNRLGNQTKNIRRIERLNKEVESLHFEISALRQENKSLTENIDILKSEGARIILQLQDKNDSLKAALRL